MKKILTKRFIFDLWEIVLIMALIMGIIIAEELLYKAQEEIIMVQSDTIIRLINEQQNEQQEEKSLKTIDDSYEKEVKFNNRKTKYFGYELEENEECYFTFDEITGQTIKVKGKPPRAENHLDRFFRFIGW